MPRKANNGDWIHDNLKGNEVITNSPTGIQIMTLMQYLDQLIEQTGPGHSKL